MRTAEYPYYNPPFSDFNVAQSSVVEFLDKDVNLVVSFATAVGKTVLAECCFGYHLSTDADCRIAFVCPFKGIASEKYAEWKEDAVLSDGGVVLSTSDSRSDSEDHMSNRLTVVTTESFDSKTRSTAYGDWIRSLACVVFDEAHLMGDKTRGGAVEMGIMRLARMNPNARIVLLSATMSNAIDLAKWVKSLNGKDTKCVKSSWRPTKIETHFHAVDGYEEQISKAVKLARKHADTKTVVFVHSKAVGAAILKRLRASKIRSAFHNASVKAGARHKIEEAFNDRMSGLNVLVSTSTLGAGVNIG